MAEFKFRTKSNAVEFAKRLTNFTQEFEKAHKKALVISTEKMRSDLYLEMRRVFDRPTRFTLNSLETVHPESRGTATENEGIVRTKLGFGSVPAGR